MADHNDRNTESFKHAYEAEAATINGKCNCGRVEVRVTENGWTAATHALCHCTNCRTSSGALASSNLVVQSDALTFDGETLAMKSYRDPNTDSGDVAVRWFCGECGSPIRTVVEGKEETSFLKSGLFKPGQLNAPAMELFKRNMEQWEKPVEGAKLM